MTPQELIDAVAFLKEAGSNGARAWVEFQIFVKKLEGAVIRNEFEPALTQADVNTIIQNYITPYQQRLAEIEAAGDALGSDLF